MTFAELLGLIRRRSDPSVEEILRNSGHQGPNLLVRRLVHVSRKLTLI
jgi:hypothetical protein